jgi:hypothetical protein
VKRIEHRACFAGWQDVYQHESQKVGHELPAMIEATLPSTDAQPARFHSHGLTGHDRPLGDNASVVKGFRRGERQF